MKRETILSNLASWVMRALSWTLRYEFHDLVGVFDPAREDPIIFVVWHNRILSLPPIFEKRRLPGQRRLTVLTSASRDGGLLAAVVGKFGISAVRGSSSRRGAIAIRELTDEILDGGDLFITPDGPRGPMYRLGPGVVFLAQKTGHGVSRIEVEMSSFWELRSWDKFRIPLPFSRVRVTLNPLQSIPPTSNEAEFEEQRLLLQNQLRFPHD